MTPEVLMVAFRWMGALLFAASGVLLLWATFDAATTEDPASCGIAGGVLLTVGLLLGLYLTGLIDVTLNWK